MPSATSFDEQQEGRPRCQQLDAAYKVDVEGSSLRLLFSSGDLVGLLDIDGIDGLVTSIWARTVCLID